MTVIPLFEMWGLLPGLLNGWKHINSHVSRLHLCDICIFIIMLYYLAGPKSLTFFSAPDS